MVTKPAAEHSPAAQKGEMIPFWVYKVYMIPQYSSWEVVCEKHTKAMMMCSPDKNTPLGNNQQEWEERQKMLFSSDVTI